MRLKICFVIFSVVLGFTTAFAYFNKPIKQSRVHISEYDSLANALTDIGTTPVTLVIDKTTTVSTNTEILSTTRLEFGPLGVFSINNGVVLTISGPIDAGNHKIFEFTGTGKVVIPLIDRPLKWFGPVADGTTSDSIPLQKAMDSFTLNGGRLLVTGYIASDSTLIWPNDGTNAYPITIVGSNVRATSGTAWSSGDVGPSLLKYTGSGIFIDGRNGDNSMIEWAGGFRDVKIIGPYTFTGGSPNVETNENSIALNIWSCHRASLQNVYIGSFGIGIYMMGGSGDDKAKLYYGAWDNVTIFSNKYGVYGYLVDINGSQFNNMRLSGNKAAGMKVDYPGDIVTISGWIEGNATYAANFSVSVGTYGGIVITNANVVNVKNSYLESNGGQHIYVAANEFYRGLVNLENNHFTWSNSRYTGRFEKIKYLNLSGNYMGSYVPSGTVGSCLNLGTGRTSPLITAEGNMLAELRYDIDATTTEMVIGSRSLLTNGSVIENASPMLTMDRFSLGAQYVKTIRKGSIFFPSVIDKAGAGGALAWNSMTDASGSMTNINGVRPTYSQPVSGEPYTTGSITNGSRTLTVISRDKDGVASDTADDHISGFQPGTAIQLDTDDEIRNASFTPATFGTSDDNYAVVQRVSSSTSGSAVLYLDKTLSSATVSDNLIRPKAIEPKYAYAYTWYKSTSNTSTSGTGEDNLKVAPELTAGMLATDSVLRVEAGGTITGTAGNHAVKLYIGTNSVTLFSGSTAAGNWRFEGEIQFTGSATQRLTGAVFYNGNATVVSANGTSALSSALVVKFTGECANAADTITQNYARIDLK